MKMQHRRMTPIIRAAPATDPMTIPAMAPPDRPLLPPPPPAAAEPDGDELEVDVGRVMVEVSVGRVTLAHRSSALEL